MPVCPCCGNEISSVQREIRMGVPDVLLAMSAEDRARRSSIGGDVFMHLDRQRFFVRALLPVRLSDGHEFHFGVWLEVPEPTAKDLALNWLGPQYMTKRFHAALANSLPPWGDSILGATVVAAPRAQDQLPYVESTTQDALSKVMTLPWPRDECEALLDRVWGRAES